jgi:putative membrane protein
MKKTVFAGVLAALLSSGAAYAQDASTTMAPATDMTAVAPAAAMTATQYVASAASSDMFEIESSKMALEMSKDPAVQKFAEHMVSDHSTTTKEIMAAAKADGIAVPAEMMPKHAEMLSQLKATDAATFDASYLQMQEMAHQEAVALHTSYAQAGDDAELMAVAKMAVPIVTEHLTDVQAIGKKA